ncbi:hypothetical protein ASG29_11760 [Sphingomonas sp. Leaf412]|uniref:hypothetical protein n=1 Tax=Sphingomonas sp. Leaf412 TaxID=1736370 RepID=UPI0006F1E019|nr:hypothetical protein [Sphingomonas sp. Leaf412]KQT32449.1 hypothetical protein ASG29_11760 [Sphingomonas sp. Leaf412]
MVRRLSSLATILACIAATAIPASAQYLLKDIAVTAYNRTNAVRCIAFILPNRTSRTVTAANGVAINLGFWSTGQEITYVVFNATTCGGSRLVTRTVTLFSNGWYQNIEMTP